MSFGEEHMSTVPHTPWQSSFIERMIDLIRRECLDYVIVLEKNYLRRILIGFEPIVIIYIVDTSLEDVCE